MKALELLKAGEPEQALNELQVHIRKNPADAKLRIFLFQLLAVLGEWERALNQLNVLHDMDASSLAMVNTYREVLSCEVFRAEVFAGKRAPLIFGKPEEWVALLVQAFQSFAGQTKASAAGIELMAQARDAAPAISGVMNDDQPFQWIADADSRLGPMLEGIVNGRYYWIPFSAISEIKFDAPEDLRDLVWMPAYFTWANGGESVGFVPTRYPGAESSADGEILLARKIDWFAAGEDTYYGLGQRVLTTDVDDYPMLDLRSVKLEAAPGEAPDVDADRVDS